MILVIDTVRGPGEHMQLNEAIMESILDKDEKVIFFTSHKYAKSFPEELQKKIIFKNTERIMSGVVGIFKTIHIILKVIFFQKRYKSIIFLSSTAYNSFITALLTHIGVIRPKVIIFLHEVSYFDDTNLSKKIAAFFIKISLKLGLANNGKFVITGEYIKKELTKRTHFKKKSTFFIEHPTSKYSHHPQINFDPDKLLKFSSVGVQCIEKHSNKIEVIANNLKDLIKNKKIDISSIGRLEYEYDQNSLVNHLGLGYEDYLIPRENFESLINQQTYFLLFLGKEYDLKTSGVVFDAIKFLKPIIGLKCNLLDFYFEKFGEIGYLFNNLDEMHIFIRSISSSFDVDRYNIQVQNLRLARESTSQENFTKQIFNLMQDN